MPVGIYKRKNPPWNKGKKCPQISLSQKGRHHSEETRIKISKVKTGAVYPNRKRPIPFSEEHKRKISQTMKGIPKSVEVRQRMSLSQRGKPRFNRRGEKCHLWKGGITPLTHQIRTCFKYRQWRSDIFHRDNFTCQVCGIKGCWVEADHYPKSFSTIFHEYKIKSLEEALNCEEFWDINNGRTVCKNHNPRGKRKER